MRVWGWVAAGLLAVLAVLSLDPAVVGLSEMTPVLQAVAMRGLLAVVLGGAGLVFVVGGALRWRASRRRGNRRAGAPALVLGLLMMLVAVGHGGVLIERGTTQEEPLGASQDGALDVLTLNTLGTAGGVDAVVTLIEDTGPDVVALQETPVDDAERIGALLDGAYQVFTDTAGPQPVQATALLVARDLGEYLPGTAPDTTFGAVWARPADGEGPELISVHAVPPVPGDVDTWREELTTLTDLCERVAGAVVAGDLNATVDHATLRDSPCVDGAVDTGGLGSWPAGIPTLLGAPIDHVLADADQWRAVASQLLDVPGDGDHRAVLVRLVPVG